MTNSIDPVALADEIAEIARTTNDRETGRRLLELVNKLLEAAGLPDNDEGGGDGLPSPWVSDSVNSAA